MMYLKTTCSNVFKTASQTAVSHSSVYSNKRFSVKRPDSKREQVRTLSGGMCLMIANVLCLCVRHLRMPVPNSYLYREAKVINE